MDSHKLQQLRQQINQIDRQMIELLAQRQQKVKAIGELKKEQDMPVFDAKRELDIRTMRRKLSKELGLDPFRLEVIFEHILTLSRDTQKTLRKEDLEVPKDRALRIGVMGGIASFSEEAGLQFLQNHQVGNYKIFYPISAENVLKALDEEKIDVGIFPIENSTAGLVIESINAASKYQFEIQEIFNFNVRHCLHVLPGVKRAEIKRVMSHPQALKQCKGYLEKNFPNAELIEATDTAEGARILEQSPDERDMAVIAPKRAGEIYHLLVLEERIQDMKVNYTRFIAATKSESLGKNPAALTTRNIPNNPNTMTPTICIIGGLGKMGQAFTQLFESQGIQVLVTDLNTSLTAEKAVKKSDIIIFSVPISQTPKIISEIAPLAKEGSLICDITSIKSPAVAAMLKYAPEGCEILGVHPMSGPEGITDLSKTVVVCCPMRTGEKSTWLLDFFTAQGAILKETTAEEQDRMMSIVQGITHISSIATAMTLQELGISVEDTLEYSSPIYKLRLEMVGRILSQSPQLYAEIAVENPSNRESLQAYHDALSTLLQCVNKKDESAFIQSFEQAAEHLGDFKEEAYQKTSELIQRSKDLL